MKRKTDCTIEENTLLTIARESSGAHHACTVGPSSVLCRTAHRLKLNRRKKQTRYEQHKRILAQNNTSRTQKVITVTMNFNVSFFKTSIFYPKNDTLQFLGLRLVTCVFHTTAAHTWPKFHLTLTKKWATVAKFEVRVTFNNESIQKIAKSMKSR